MTLSTFGAIVGFAAEMVRNALDIYKASVQKAKDPVLKETLQLLVEEDEKNFSLLEQTRRENVTEMILEPIRGLYPEDYKMKVSLSDQVKDADLLKMALIIEEKEQRFFRDASDKFPFPEVSRIFRKISQKKEKNLTKLKSLGLN